MEAHAHRSLESGTLCQGREVLRRVGEHLDKETARTIFHASGLR